MSSELPAPEIAASIQPGLNWVAALKKGRTLKLGLALASLALISLLWYRQQEWDPNRDQAAVVFFKANAIQLPPSWNYVVSEDGLRLRCTSRRNATVDFYSLSAYLPRLGPNLIVEPLGSNQDLAYIVSDLGKGVSRLSGYLLRDREPVLRVEMRFGPLDSMHDLLRDERRALGQAWWVVRNARRLIASPDP